MRKLTLLTTVLLSIAILFTGCKKDDDKKGETPQESDKFTVVLAAEAIDGDRYVSTANRIAYTTNQAIANKATIDITFGYGDLTDISLISPDARGKCGLTFGGEQDVADLVSTTFATQPNITNLEDPDITEDFISKLPTEGEPYIAIEVGKTYSFYTSLNKKGLLYIDKLEGKGPEALATISIIVQK